MFLSKSEYISLIESLLPDNSTQEISPLDLRTALISLADSVPSFLVGNSIDTLNFSTPSTRTTKAGDMALSSMFLAGRSSLDNSAFGYASLRNNYNGYYNTAVGSYALSCNLYGSGNTAVGYQALAGNVVGNANVGIGNYTLNNNRRGSYNIAIGHGAGWYLGPEDDYTFSLGSIVISSGEMCASGEQVASGQSPLMYGNLRAGEHKLAIGSNQLHNYGMLQVSGDISPSVASSFSLGRSQYPWASINDDIIFSGGKIGVGGQPSGLTDAKMTVYGDIVPSISRRYSLGDPNLLWDAYLNDVIVSGNITVNDIEYNTITQCLYECKTLHLATSGFCDPEGDGFHNDAVCGYLNDQGLDGAGFEIHSSGADYVRDYRFIYKFPDPTLYCLPQDNAFTKSRWESNISIELLDGASLISDRLLGRSEVSVVTNSGCMGVFIQPYDPSGQRVTVAQKQHVLNEYPTLVDVNFISRSGTDIIDGNPSGYDYSVMYGTVDSGVKVIQKFASRIRSSETARGFSIIYHDELDQMAYVEDGINAPGNPNDPPPEDPPPSGDPEVPDGGGGGDEEGGPGSGII